MIIIYIIIYILRGGILENFNNDNELEFDSKWVENNIAEKLMISAQKNWKKIRGGNYVRFDVEYAFPKNKFVKNLPDCYCGIPCDVKQNEKDNYLYFRCAKKNIWDDMCDKFYIFNKPCKYFMKYTKDSEYKLRSKKT